MHRVKRGPPQQPSTSGAGIEVIEVHLNCPASGLAAKIDRRICRLCVEFDDPRRYPRKSDGLQGSRWDSCV